MTKIISLWKLNGSITSALIWRSLRELRLIDSTLEPEGHKVSFQNLFNNIENDIVNNRDKQHHYQKKIKDNNNNNKINNNNSVGGAEEGDESGNNDNNNSKHISYTHKYYHKNYGIQDHRYQSKKYNDNNNNNNN